MIHRVLSGSVPFSISTRSTPSPDTLPDVVRGLAHASYRVEPTGRLHVDSLGLRIPGLFAIEAMAMLDGVSFDGSSGDPLEDTRLHSLSVRMVDLGFIDAFENSRAWLGGWPSNGLFNSLAKGLQGRTGRAIQAFLRPGGSPKVLRIELEPFEPLSVAGLGRVDGGTWHLTKTLGLRAELEEPLRSSDVTEFGLE